MMLRETYFTDGVTVHRIREEYVGSSNYRYTVTDAERVFGCGDSTWHAFGRFVQCREADVAHDVFATLEGGYRQEPSLWVQSVDDPTRACFTCMRRAWKVGAPFRTPVNAMLVTSKADRHGKKEGEK